MFWTNVSKTIGLCRSMVHVYRKLAIELGKINVDDRGKEIITDDIQQLRDSYFLEKEEFVKHPLVEEWIDDLLTRKQGQPIKTWKNHVTRLRTICNSCKIKPEQLLIDRKTTEKIIKNYVLSYYKSEKHTSNKNSNIIPKSRAYCSAQVVRSFCSFHGLTWPKGVSGIMSGKVVGHGKYADIKLTSSELKMADKFIKETWGIDSDIYRVFWIGIESCARKTALLNMKCEWREQISKNSGKRIFVMTVFESKTVHIKDGKWVKYITRNDTQQSLELHKNKKYSRIWTSFGKYKSTQNQLRDQLREIFRHLEKSEEYYYKNPFHALRHIGAHYWLEKTDYNYGFVAKIGGWHTIDELKNSYGDMPTEFIINMIESRI